LSAGGAVEKEQSYELAINSSYNFRCKSPTPNFIEIYSLILKAKYTDGRIKVKLFPEQAVEVCRVVRC
jgi:hypothetical protein